MAKIELTLPAMGEGIIEATIIKWLVSEGSAVEEDQPLIEIATDKVDSEIPSPAKGVLAKILMKEGEIPSVGDILAIIETGVDVSTPAGAPSGKRADVSTPAGAPSEERADVSTPAGAPSEERAGESGQNAEEKEVDGAGTGPGDGSGIFPGIPRQTSSGKFLTPLVRNIARKENISSDELEKIKGSGEGGRLNKQDLLNYLEKQTSPEPGPETGTGKAPTGIEKQDADLPDQPERKGAGKANEETAGNTITGTEGPGGDRIIEMDRMRKLIASRMVSSKQVSPHVTSFIDADVTNLVRWREASKKEFRERENQSLTFTPIFIDAAVKALRDYPMVNISVDGTNIIVKKSINIGMAVALSDGNLIVPVIKNAGEKNLAGLAIAVNDLAARARANKLRSHEITGGTFTITNFGTFRNTTGTPIINQPEVAILGTGVIIKKPVVIETAQGDVIAIRHIMTLSLSYDHRVVDGALGGRFLQRICEYLENFDTGMRI